MSRLLRHDRTRLHFILDLTSLYVSPPRSLLLTLGCTSIYASPRDAFGRAIGGGDVGSGMPVAHAGALVASTDAVAMLLLVPLSLLTRWTGLRPLLLVMPLLGLIAATVLICEVSRKDDGEFDATFAHGTRGAADFVAAPGLLNASELSVVASSSATAVVQAQATPRYYVIRAALLILSISEVVCPIVPLALVPAAAGDVLGAAYGTIDGMLGLAQMSIALLFGVLRSAYGFQGALCLMAAGFCATVAVSLPLMARTSEAKKAPAECHER